MIFIIIVVCAIIVFYYWTSIKSMLSFFGTTQTEYLPKIWPWFFSLLFINVIICIVQIWFYNSKTGVNGAGPQGSLGPVGFNGYEGTPCTVGCK
jgi:hypothetical protein